MQSIKDVALKNSILVKAIEEGKLKKPCEMPMRCIWFTAHYIIKKIFISRGCQIKPGSLEGALTET